MNVINLAMHNLYTMEKQAGTCGLDASGTDMNQLRALVNTIMTLQVSYKAENFLTRRVTISFSRRNLLHGIVKSFIRELKKNVRF
jgi:hypothetical protein